jgi:DNA-binding CsgD family transcriptional regulator
MMTADRAAWLGPGLTTGTTNLLPQGSEIDPAAARRALMAGGWVVTAHTRGETTGTLVAWSVAGLATDDELRPVELDVAARRAAGSSIKVIAADLGKTVPWVARVLGEATRKLRLRSVADLIVLLGAGLGGARARYVCRGDDRCIVLTYATPLWLLPGCLSGAEQRVVTRLVRGESQREIARACGIAPRTVANHLASVYRKMRVGSRVELLATLSRPERATRI